MLEFFLFCDGNLVQILELFGRCIAEIKTTIHGKLFEVPILSWFHNLLLWFQGRKPNKSLHFPDKILTRKFMIVFGFSGQKSPIGGAFQI